MLTLQKRRILSLMDIPIWRKRQKPLCKPEQPVYSIREVVVLSKQKHYTVITELLIKPSEIALFEAITSAMGECSARVFNASVVGASPIILLGLASETALINTATVHFNYTINQLDQQPALKRALWQQIKSFLGS